ncbi:hypothetical protein [Longitalea luteola]|uniref:hypothetical protein n=1 Tax=Longitalea luteola TaxID=2812563 RepID=UPI001A960E79|nr:hypothetical protein [Longitalea luteola]
MRTISLILLLFSSTAIFGQKRSCSFSYRKINTPNSKYTQKLVSTIDTLHLKTCRGVEDIPDFIINTLECWAGYDWSIANAGSPYYETGIKGPEAIPARQLMYMGLNDHYLLMAYKRGGLPLNCPTILFKFEDQKILDVWYWGGTNEGIQSKEDILQYCREHAGSGKHKPVL